MPERPFGLAPPGSLYGRRAAERTRVLGCYKIVRFVRDPYIAWTACSPIWEGLRHHTTSSPTTTPTCAGRPLHSTASYRACQPRPYPCSAGPLGPVPPWRARRAHRCHRAGFPPGLGPAGGGLLARRHLPATTRRRPARLLCPLALAPALFVTAPCPVAGRQRRA